MDLDRTARELAAVEAHLEPHVAPIRARLRRLGPAGLYALAATEQRQADLAPDSGTQRAFLAAAEAAERLADLAVRER